MAIKKKHILEALEEFDPEDFLMVNDSSWCLVIKRICGAQDPDFGYTCVRDPGHEGPHYCSVKNLQFELEVE